MLADDNIAITRGNDVVDDAHYPQPGTGKTTQVLMFGWPDWASVEPLLDPGRAERMARLSREVAELAAGAIHRDGVRWDDAPLPPLLHWCRWQTRIGTRTGHQLTERCACGAARALSRAVGGRFAGRWTGRNCRRWGRPPAASRWRRALARWGRMST